MYIHLFGIRTDIFRYLIPGHHVMPNQLPIVGSPDVYCQGARRFLQLLPSACVNAEKKFLDSIKGPSPQPSPEASRTSSPHPPPLLTSSPANSSHLEKPTPLQLAVPVLGTSTNPFDAPLSRSRSGSDASSCSLSSSSSAPQSSLPSAATSTSGSTNVIGSYQFVYIPQTIAYLDYLEAAREAVFTCATRCKCWGNAYDRCDPPKEALMDNEVKDSKALEMEDIHVHVTHEEEDFSTSSRFRSRAVTMSHSRLSRISSVKAHDRLKPLGDRERQRSSREDASETQERLKHGGGSPRASPRLWRRSLDETKSRFEDTAGLLLKILLEKLSEMLQHPPHVNILLTRLIGRLAHYPQPLLRSLLLNHQLVLKPGVPNLLTVSLQPRFVAIDCTGYPLPAPHAVNTEVATQAVISCLVVSVVECSRQNTEYRSLDEIHFTVLQMFNWALLFHTSITSRQNNNLTKRNNNAITILIRLLNSYNYC